MKKLLAFLCCTLLLGAAFGGSREYILDSQPPSVEVSDLVQFEISLSSTQAGAKTPVAIGSPGQIFIPITADSAVTPYAWSRARWADDPTSFGDYSNFVLLDDITYRVLSAVISADGSKTTVKFSDDTVLNGGAPELVGAAGAIALSSPTGGPAEWVFSNAVIVAAGELYTLQYTQPGGGIANTRGGDLPSFSGMLVQNNSKVGHVDFQPLPSAPGGLLYLPRNLLEMTISVTTDGPATCRATIGESQQWDDYTPMTTADDLTHTLRIPVPPGVVHNQCVRCQSLGTLSFTDTKCRTVLSRRD